MREILFRGKRIDNNDWVEGLPCYGGGLYPDSIETREGNVYGVSPSTICQFTGLTDANGEKIFEGDIVECAREDEPLKVEWCEDTARFILSASTFCCDFDNYWGYEVEVIGNIYDNPELWKED